MINCTKCGEGLDGPWSDCPVCATLRDSGNSNAMADDQDKQGAGADLSGQSPAFGGASDAAAAAANPPPPPPPPQGANADPDYHQKFRQAALEFGSDAYVFRQLEILQAANVPAVLFLGVRTSGKTWLMQRMKHVLRNKYDCVPPLAIDRDRLLKSSDVQKMDAEAAFKEMLSHLPPDERKAAEEMRAANSSDRTGAIIFHSFIHSSGNFALIDVPGERIEQIARGQFKSNRDLLAALRYASAIIVAMPADVVLLGEELREAEPGTEDAGAPEQPQSDVHALDRLQDDVELLDGFIDGIGTIAAVRSLIQASNIPLRWRAPGDTEDEFDTGVTPESVLQHRLNNTACLPIGGRDGSDCPAFFALTKSDRFFAALDFQPDAANASVAAQKRFNAANRELEQSADITILRQCYSASPINPDNRPLDNDLFSRLFRSISGAGVPTVEISNPPELVRTFNTALFNRLTDYMPMSRMDLVAAFYGNTRNTLQRSDFKRTEFVGVNELIRWMGEVRSGVINDWHVWARNVFRHLYGSSEDQGGPFGGPGKYAARKRIRLVPRPVLKAMFRKEWSIFQWLPLVLAVVGTFGMAYASAGIDWWPWQKLAYKDAATYQAFQTVVDGKTNGTTGELPSGTPAAILAIEPQPIMPAAFKNQNVEEWNPVKGLIGWNPRGEGYLVPVATGPTRALDVIMPDIEYEKAAGGAEPAEKDTPGNRFLKTRTAQRAWMNTHVCEPGALTNDLSGWGEYQDIVRLAIINGYGDCSGLVKATAHSPMMAMLGTPIGMLAIIFGWLIVAGTFVFAYWLYRARKAYAWLYHSVAATSHRAPAKDNDEGAA